MFGMNEVEKRLKESEERFRESRLHADILHQKEIDESLNSLVGKKVIVDFMRIHNYIHFLVSGTLRGPFEGKYIIAPLIDSYVSFSSFSVENITMGEEPHIEIEV